MNIVLYLSIFLQLSPLGTHSVPVNTTGAGMVDITDVTTQPWDTGDYITTVGLGPAEDEDPLHIIYHGTMSMEQYRLVQFITSKCLLPVVCIIGVIGNIISLAVFIKQGAKIRLSTQIGRAHV